MTHPLFRRLLVAAIVLTTGCRSERVAFEFRPAPQPAVAAAPLPAADSPAGPASAAVVAEVAAAPDRQPTSRPMAPVRRAAQTPARRYATRPHRTETTARRAVRRTPGEDEPAHKTLHIILGGLLVLGGVAGGILLGGWLGLGVGALVVLGGYYFLGLAFGGKHGWLEVFQEFFNM